MLFGNIMISDKMEKSELIYLASKAFDKRWDFETLKYGDDLYGKE